MTAATDSRPRRLRRRRVRGWRRPADAVIVDRTSRWGNPFAVSRPAGPLAPNPDEIITDRARAVAIYKEWFAAAAQAELRAAARTRLAGRDLLFPCPPGEPCHGDVLLAYANRRPA